MGFAPEVAQTAVRFSLGDGVTAEQVGEVVRAVREGLCRGAGGLRVCVSVGERRLLVSCQL